LRGTSASAGAAAGPKRAIALRRCGFARSLDTGTASC